MTESRSVVAYGGNGIPEEGKKEKLSKGKRKHLEMMEIFITLW